MPQPVEQFFGRVHFPAFAQRQAGAFRAVVVLHEHRARAFAVGLQHVGELGHHVLIRPVAVVAGAINADFEAAGKLFTRLGEAVNRIGGDAVAAGKIIIRHRAFDHDQGVLVEQVAILLLGFFVEHHFDAPGAVIEHAGDDFAAALGFSGAGANQQTGKTKLARVFVAVTVVRLLRHQIGNRRQRAIGERADFLFVFVDGVAGEIQPQGFLFVRQPEVVVPVGNVHHVHIGVGVGIFYCAEHVVLPGQRIGLMFFRHLQGVVQAGHQTGAIAVHVFAQRIHRAAFDQRFHHPAVDLAGVAAHAKVE